MTKPTIIIDWARFNMAFDIDEQYHNPYFIDRYLDKISGEILFIYEDDSAAAMDGGDALENKKMRDLVKENPDDYLEIVGRSHGESHEILQEFLESSWTDDKKLKLDVISLYHGSIGGWIKNVRKDIDLEKDPETIIEAYKKYKSDTIERDKDTFLKQNGIKYKWG